MSNGKLLATTSREELAESLGVDPKLFDGSKSLYEMACALGIRNCVEYRMPTLWCTAKDFFENKDLQSKFILITMSEGFKSDDGKYLYFYTMHWEYCDIGDGDELHCMVYPMIFEDGSDIG